MIMGNTDIDLPSDTINGTDKTNGIPAVSTHQESRSVLENKIEIYRSPRSLPVSSEDVKTRTACMARRKKAHALTVLPVYNNVVGKSSNLVGKHTLSWADIVFASKRRKE
jgi:hypothetical protein